MLGEYSFYPCFCSHSLIRRWTNSRLRIAMICPQQGNLYLLPGGVAITTRQIYLHTPWMRPMGCAPKGTQSRCIALRLLLGESKVEENTSSISKLCTFADSPSPQYCQCDIGILSKTESGSVVAAFRYIVFRIALVDTTPHHGDIRPIPPCSVHDNSDVRCLLLLRRHHAV